MYSIPILFQFYNQKDTTLRVFEAIRKQKPTKLFLVQDAPRPNHPEEATQCRELRNEVLARVDWNCALQTNFREENLGPGAGTAEAIRWFFDQVEMGLIFEHECLRIPNFSNTLRSY